MASQGAEEPTSDFQTVSHDQFEETEDGYEEEEKGMTDDFIDGSEDHAQTVLLRTPVRSIQRSDPPTARAAEDVDQNALSELTHLLNPKQSRTPKKKPKKPVTDVIPEDGPKRVFRSQRHINRVAKRLSQPKPAPTPAADPPDPIRKAPADPKTFERLYEQSRQKEVKQQELQRQYESAEMQERQLHSAKTCKRSLSLVSEQVSRFLHTLFEDQEEIDVESLSECLRGLGILNPRDNLTSLAVLEQKSQPWQQENGFYDPKAVVGSLEKAMNATKPTAFELYIKQEIMIAIANGFKVRKHKEGIAEVIPNKTMQKTTFDRLTKLRESDVSKKPREALKRPKFVPKINFDDQLPGVSHSEVTKGILEHSELGQLPLEARDQKLAERRVERIRRLEEAEIERHERREKAQPMPELTPEMKQKLEERKERIRNQPPDEPTFRPQVTKYEDFLKVRESMFQPHTRPEGWDASVTRLRAGYGQFLQLKEAQGFGAEPLRVRASSRARQSD
jgi:hypothetical protein